MAGGLDGEDFTYAWAWIDEAAGTLRSRAFPTGLGIAEDEATAAAAVRLGDQLGRAVTIRQGVGSQLLARPGPPAPSRSVAGSPSSRSGPGPGERQVRRPRASLGSPRIACRRLAAQAAASAVEDRDRRGGEVARGPPVAFARPDDVEDEAPAPHKGL